MPQARTTRASSSTTASHSAASAAAEPALDFMRMMWLVDHQLHSVSKRMQATLGLTAPQRLALRLIGRQPGLTPGELAALLHLHPGTITGIVRRLEAARLVTRVRSDGDTRRMHLSLSERGHALNRRRKGTVEAAVLRMLDRLSTGDVEATGRVLAALAHELAEVNRG